MSFVKNNLLHCNNIGVGSPAQPNPTRRASRGNLPRHGERPIRSNRSFAIAVAISLGLGAVLMFVSLHHAATHMQAFS